VDPQRFDGKIRKLAQMPSRRALLGGSLAASLLALFGFGAEAGKKKPTSRRCLAAGRRCGTRKNDPPCKKCCHRNFVTLPDGKRKCACRISGAACSNSSQCCSGICADKVCQQEFCAAIGESCIEVDCCSGECEEQICANCLPIDAPCNPEDDLCCSWSFCDPQDLTCRGIE
jgi:hypothetical protein